MMHFSLGRAYLTWLVSNVIWIQDTKRYTLLLSYATAKALDVPVKWRIEPNSPLDAPKWLILYTPETANSGTHHSIVA